MNPESLARAAEIIRAGGVVAYPTEACFGLGCDPRNAQAMRRILRIKRRPRAKGLILIAARRSQLRPYVASFAVNYRAQMLASWPGPHTWLLPAHRHASRWLRGDHASIAVRVTAHRVAAALCALARTPLVSTSANRAHRRMLRSAQAVRREFGDEIDFVVDARIGNAHAPSCIRCGETGEAVRG
ncbi:MAG: L-threonylcarbamoyladenylate synthase [bacterium]